MSEDFFRQPILNSPYDYPSRHWELDSAGQPTQNIAPSRRRPDFITPIPKPKKRKAGQAELGLEDDQGLSSARQQYDLTSIINQVRGAVDAWRKLPEGSWAVTPEAARLLKHWRHYDFGGVRPFFSPVEAVETAIWLTEVAPNVSAGKVLLEHLAGANRDSNPELNRLALKLATGAGKTTVMASRTRGSLNARAMKGREQPVAGTKLR
jgi:type III restriction enzyme